MNKAKLVELADEVLTEIDVDMKNVLRTELELELCNQLSSKFHNASHCVRGKMYKGNDLSVAYALGLAKDKEAYKSVKPILDDCIDKLLGETK